MLKKEIKIIRDSIGDDEILFEIVISNESNLASISFEGQPDIFKKFAEELLTFPKKMDSEIKFEYQFKGYYSILLRVFCHNINGHVALHVKVSSSGYRPREEIYHNSSEFYILTVPVLINQLGELLKKWNPITENEMIWTAE